MRNERDRLLSRIIKDSQFSLRAKGIAAVSLALDEMPTTARELGDHCTEGRDAIVKAMNEHVSRGTAIRDNIQDPETGMFRKITRWNLKPKPDSQGSVITFSPRPAFPASVDPASDSPASVSQGGISTTIVKTTSEKNKKKKVIVRRSRQPKPDSQGTVKASQASPEQIARELKEIQRESR